MGLSGGQPPHSAEERGHELTDHHEEYSPAHPVAQCLRRIGGDVSGQEWPRDERRNDCRHQSSDRSEAQTGQEDRNVEPVWRDAGPPSEEIRR